MANAVLTAEFQQLSWESVVSSNLDAVAYAEGIGRLWVRFKRKPGKHSHSIYAYDHVPKQTYAALLAAGSKGKYFAANIKNTYAVRPFS